IDFKHCHGYLGHELLAARERKGRYGGDFEGRTRFLRSVVDGIRAEVPGLKIAVRLSAFDTVPFRKDAAGRGEPERDDAGYSSAFGLLQGEALDEALAERRELAGLLARLRLAGALRKGEALDEGLAESRELLGLLRSLGVRWISISAGSPYYNPHL